MTSGTIQRHRPDPLAVLDSLRASMEPAPAFAGAVHATWAIPRGTGRPHRPRACARMSTACLPQHPVRSRSAAGGPCAGLSEPVDIILLAYNRVDYLSEM